MTKDEFSGGLMTTEVDGEIQQQTPTNDVVFTPEFLFPTSPPSSR